jgi:hypothetical protein
MVPPQYVFSQRRFKAVALDPPDFKPGSWVGAGNCLFDGETRGFLLTARLRKAEKQARGFAANIYRSQDGEGFELVESICKREIAEKSGLEIQSLEGLQLLKDPLTGNWHFYISVNTDEDFVWGGIHWQTCLLIADRIEGPWRPAGLVLKNDQPYDAHQARDINIGIVDGRWYCLYKARDAEHKVRTALAISADGIAWRKLGPLSVDGRGQRAWVSGTFFGGAGGALFLGLERVESDRPEVDVVYADEHKVGHGGGPARDFVAYTLDYRNRNLELVFRAPWDVRSPYEHRDHPVLGYASLVYDPIRNRILTYVEAIDGTLTERIGINETVERLLVYETVV